MPAVKAKSRDEVSGATSKPLQNRYALADITENASLSRQERRAQLLILRSTLTDSLTEHGLQPQIIFDRGATYKLLGYADLAAADFYLALTLAETGLDPDFSDLEPIHIVDDEMEAWPPAYDPRAAWHLKIDSMQHLIECLVELDCLQDAYNYVCQMNEAWKEHGRGSADTSSLEKQIRVRLNKRASTKASTFKDEHINLATAKLPNSGFARREIYPWNTHEPDRSAEAALQELNSRLRLSAPDLEVRSTNLPLLENPLSIVISHDEHDGYVKLAIGESPESNHSNPSPSSSISPTPLTSAQLGLFTVRHLPPGTSILHENSTLTATRTLHASLCDNCSSPLPSLSSPTPPVPCSSCPEAAFCSQQCHDLAQTLYHPILCGNDDGVDEVGRDPTSNLPAEDLHFLLVARALAMAAHQSTHPLNLSETKYLWGEFVPVGDSVRTLPFSLLHNVVLPFRFLTALDLCGSYLTHPDYTSWVINTLYAKCRGVASARQSTWDGRPEVAAVHPMWCLANHSCNPNVEWSWGGEQNELDGAAKNTENKESASEGNGGQIIYRVRNKRVWSRSGGETHGSVSEESEEWQGIGAGEEIFNHYCDVRLPVQERREWARGPLGGDCMCERCMWESNEQNNSKQNEQRMRNGE